MARNILHTVYEALRTDSQKQIYSTFVAVWQQLPEELRTDADAMIYSTRQLEHVMSEVYEEDFPDLVVANGEILPIDTSIHEGAKTWTYYLYSGTTVARFQAEFSDGTLPRVTRTGAEVTRHVRVEENSYAYKTSDLRHASMAKDNLDGALASLAKRGHDQLFHRTGLWGRPDIQIDGFLNHPNITISTAAQPFQGADVDDIIETFRILIKTVPQLTKGLRHVTRVLLSRRVVDLLETRRLGPGDGAQTIMSYLEATFGRPKPGRKQPAIEFMILEELDWTVAQEEAEAGVQNVDIDDTTGDCMIAYVHNDRKVARFMQPMPFKQHPVQFFNLEFQVPCESSHGGIRLPEPLTIHRVEGVYF